tara:strand:+ start:383 stop:517 length:135 start_codon:yes stop_codon:yes gene_type:complete
MRTQDEINLISLQKHLKDAFVLATFLDHKKTAELIQQAWDEITR